MQKIRIEIPDKIIYTATIPVRITDINYGNHLGNDALVSIIHEARMQWLKASGFTSELAIGSIGLIMSSLAVEYKAESFYGDILSVEMSCGDVRSAAFNLYYVLYKEKSSGKLLVANAMTSMVCFDYQRRKPVPIPEVLQNILA